MLTRVSRRAGWMLFLCLALLPSAAAADPIRIFESAKLGPSEDQNLSYALFAGQFTAVPLSVTVEAGWYALVFGSGLFGASGAPPRSLAAGSRGGRDETP